MSTLMQLPQVVAGLAEAIASLPPQLAADGLNFTVLSAMLANLSTSLTPILDSLSGAQVSSAQSQHEPR
jgi:hypothetical protein